MPVFVDAKGLGVGFPDPVSPSSMGQAFNRMDERSHELYFGDDKGGKVGLIYTFTFVKYL